MMLPDGSFSEFGVGRRTLMGDESGRVSADGCNRSLGKDLEQLLEVLSALEEGPIDPVSPRRDQELRILIG